MTYSLLTMQNLNNTSTTLNCNSLNKDLSLNKSRFSPRFWGKCAAICMALAAQNVSATYDGMRLNENEHDITTPINTAISLPTASGNVGAYTYTFLDSNGASLGVLPANGTGTFTTTITMSPDVITSIINWDASNSNFTYSQLNPRPTQAPDNFTIQVMDSVGQIALDTYRVNKNSNPNLAVTSPAHILDSNDLTNGFNLAFTGGSGGLAGVTLLTSTGQPTTSTNNTWTMTNGGIVGWTGGAGDSITFTPSPWSALNEYFTFVLRDNDGQMAAETFKYVAPTTLPAGATSNSKFTLISNVVVNTSGKNITVDHVVGAFGLSFVGGGSVKFNPDCLYTGSTNFDALTQLMGSIPMSSSSYPRIIVDANHKYTEAGRFTGPSALVKDGSGDFEMNNASQNANNYAGGTIIKNGRLIANMNQIPSRNPTTSDAITFNASENIIPVLVAGSNLTNLTNNINFTSKGSISNENALTISGQLAGGQTAYKENTGELTINADNSARTGEMHVKGGAIATGLDTNLGAPSAALHLESGHLHVTGTFSSSRVVHLGGSNPV